MKFHAVLFAVIFLVTAARRFELGLRKETLTEAECETVVEKVESSKRYTEEAILPICKENTEGSSRCDFFSEALSLASSHPDFTSTVFCKNIADAHFCSQTMDILLSSPAIADLMLGECLRSKDGPGLHKCKRLQKILGYAVRNDDLDTMRACYMVQAYGDFDAMSPAKGEKIVVKAQPVDVPEPRARIITSSSQEAKDFGLKTKNASAAAFPTGPQIPVPRTGIVLKPHPLQDFGTKVKLQNSTQLPADALATAPKQSIIVEAVPLKTGGEETTAEKKVEASTETKKSSIIEEPVPMK